MLPATKDADLSQKSNVLERETNVAENGVPRKKTKTEQQREEWNV